MSTAVSLPAWRVSEAAHEEAHKIMVAEGDARTGDPGGNPLLGQLLELQAMADAAWKARPASAEDVLMTVGLAEWRLIQGSYRPSGLRRDDGKQS